MVWFGLVSFTLAILSNFYCTHSFNSSSFSPSSCSHVILKFLNLLGAGPVKFCWDLQKSEFGKVFNAPWPESSFIINHYARSLEKFTLKQRTWKQHVNAGYDISKYFERGTELSWRPFILNAYAIF